MQKKEIEQLKSMISMLTKDKDSKVEETEENTKENISNAISVENKKGRPRKNI